MKMLTCLWKNPDSSNKSRKISMWWRLSPLKGGKKNKVFLKSFCFLMESHQINRRVFFFFTSLFQDWISSFLGLAGVSSPRPRIKNSLCVAPGQSLIKTDFCPCRVSGLAATSLQLDLESVHFEETRC